ncbi:MAG: FAD-dependent oxidoreductase [Planctomycetota bacterium]
MGAAVWSATPEKMLEFPARTLVTFFENHGFLQVEGRPKWLVVEGGSREWVRALLDRFQGEVRPSTPVLGIQRDERGVQVFMEPKESSTKRVETFDRVVLATHGDQALRILGEEAKPLEREVLSSFQTQENRAFLHTDERLLPRRPLARAAWNYHILPEDERPQGATVSYWMNLLQGFEDGNPWIVSLNMGAQIAPEKIEREIVYRHPIYTTEAIAAQGRHSEINGLDRVYFAGAYWGYGFHEDGVKSALAVVKDFEGREKKVG